MTAQTATNATNAQNATALGGEPPSAYLLSTGDTTYRYPGNMAINYTGAGTFTTNNFGGASITVAANQSIALAVPLPRPTAQFGRFLAVKSLRVCYVAPDAGIKIDRTRLFANEHAAVDEIDVIVDETDRNATTHTCYDLTVATPQAVAGMNYLLLAVVNGPGATRTLTLDSLALTLTPLAAGAAEVPGDGSGGESKP